MIKQMSVIVEARVEGAAKLSERAQRFIENQGPRAEWGEVWNEVSLAQARLEELKAFEAEILEEYAEQPLTQIDPFAVLDSGLAKRWEQIRAFAENAAARITDAVDAVIISLDRSLELQARAADTIKDQAPVAEELLDTVEHGGVTFEYYLTCEESGLVSFNVEASAPVSMRLKAKDEVIRPGDDELSLKLALYEDFDMEAIEHYVGDELVWTLG
jgi:hypothetical protein